ncbi:DUF1778 domain-containing protein [Spirillospora sp. NPDC029432]|uniref:type II toxin -antitoxin system TacA 1-like antitoxin n=1 Tax=Spirillospora sp. NPDC029432 TaxID=3154599 RepID=UPI00345441E9
MQDLPTRIPGEHLELWTSEEQHLAIRKAAELVGWTVTQYILSAALDRAERDLYWHAATRPREEGESVEPYVALVTALG